MISSHQRRRARLRIKDRLYDRNHRELRASLVPLVESGVVRCVRCQGLIAPGSRWDLGHDDLRPGAYAGPEHAVCNRGAPMRNRVSRRW